MKVIKSIRSLKQEITDLKRKGKSIALVPTMGALHAGHVSLIELAKSKSEKVVVSIFVNPAQFGKDEDFEKYPRDAKGDLAILKKLNVDMVFMPAVEQIYPEEYSNSYSFTIHVGKLGNILEGRHRPGHFDEVATIVMKLFMLTQPDVAVFGEKDYQQLVIIKKLVNDLNIPVKILAGKTIREKDGLAMSSRNIYLSKSEREIAGKLYNILKEAAYEIKKVGRGNSLEKIIAKAKKLINKAGFTKIDYLEPRAKDTFEPCNIIKKDTASLRLLTAVRLGQTRLIDNIEV